MPTKHSPGTTYPIRVIGIYATHWRYRKHTPSAQPGFELGLLEEFHHLFQDQLPRVLFHEWVPVQMLAFAPPGRPTVKVTEITSAEFWLFVLPSDQVVAAVALDFPSPDLNEDSTLVVKILEFCAYSQILISDFQLLDHIGRRAGRVSAEKIDNTDKYIPLPPERHQIVLARKSPGKEPPSQDVMKRILYRINPPYRQEFMPLALPSGLNQEESTYGAVTPYVSLLFGHEKFVNDSVFLTTVQAVGTAVRFRQIWHAAHQNVRVLRGTGQVRKVGAQRHADLEGLLDELGNLELDLSFSVETSADLGLLIPALRIESFHRELYRVMELPARASTVSQMFVRLDSSIRSELTAIDIRERWEEEEKRLHGAIAVSVRSIVIMPIFFILAFFGINAVEVSGKRSVFDLSYYLDVYIVAGVLALIPVVVFFVLHRKAWRRVREEGRRRRASAALQQAVTGV